MTYATFLRADAVALHSAQFDSMTTPGHWLTGAQRRVIAQLVRHAGVEAGIFPPEAAETVADDHPFAGNTAFVDAIVRLAVSPATFQRENFEAAVAEDCSVEQYVEMVGLVSRLINLDIVRIGVGLPLLPLPEPQAGEPSRHRPQAVSEGAWAPTVPSGETAEAMNMYGSPGEMPFIIRALSLVPSEHRQHVELGHIQYLPLNRFHDFKFQQHEGLTRPQVELLAGRVSAINECFY